MKQSPQLLSNAEVLERARNKRSINATQRRNATQFVLSYRGGGTAQITGYSALADALNISENSIPVLLSRGSDNSFQLMRPNPVTDEQDIVTVTRLKETSEPKRRGRPCKADITDERLGSEAACSVQTKRRR